MSTLSQAEIINAVVLLAVLQADLGRQRKIGWHRIMRPIFLAAAIVPLFLGAVSTRGGGLTLELVGAAAGALGGLAALFLTRVYRSRSTGNPVSAAGWGYAILWTVVIGARAAFSFGATHWFEAPLSRWLTVHSIPATAITDALIFMAVAMLLTRTLGLVLRARSVSAQTVSSVGYARS